MHDFLLTVYVAFKKNVKLIKPKVWFWFFVKEISIGRKQLQQYGKIKKRGAFLFV